MRKWGIVLILVMSLLSGCASGGAENPALAIGEFMIAIKAKDFEEARKYLTKDASSMYSDRNLEKFREFFSGVTINDPDSITITGNTAEGRILSYTSDKTADIMNVNLLKNGNKWRISSAVLP